MALYYSTTSYVYIHRRERESGKKLDMTRHFYRSRRCCWAPEAQTLSLWGLTRTTTSIKRPQKDEGGNIERERQRGLLLL